ncbi:aspartate/glutamate racemase family protein [Chloroflexota bacterium]
MKIACQLPTRMPRSGTNIAYYDLLEKIYDLVRNNDTEVQVRDTPTGFIVGDRMKWTGLRLINEVEVLKAAIAEEKEGFDGISIACFFDPALRPSRQLLNIPVTGLAESSMRLASFMGGRFAIIAANVLHVPAMQEEIARYHMESQAINRNPVRALPVSDKGYSPEKFHDFLNGDCSPLIESFYHAARSCIEDGADIIIAGCGLISPLLTRAGITEIDNAAVIDPLLASLKQTETLVALHKAGLPYISRRSYYSAVPPIDIEETLA